MKRTELDGVPVLWEEASGPFMASLIFGVGVRHETFRTVGVTHLIEHLVMGTLPKSPLDHNATVEIDTTAFYATGRPEAVVDFIHAVCAALSDLPMGKLGTELGVLAAEDALVEHPAMCTALGLRYGNAGPGLAGSVGAGPSNLTEAHVREHLRYFVRTNAVLIATGEPPADLRLLLPDGGRPEPAPLVRSQLPLPARLSTDAPFPSLTLELDEPDGLALGVTAHILAERVTDDLRHGRGLAYDIDWTGVRFDRHTAVMALWADARDGEAGTVAAGLWDHVRRLADAGPEAVELERQREGLEEQLADPRDIPDRLQHNAWRLLTDQPLQKPADAVTALAKVDAVQIRNLLTEALPTALMQLSGDVDVELPGLPDADAAPRVDEPFVGRSFDRRILAIAPLRLSVVAGDEGVTLRLGKEVISLRWRDVVGLAVNGDRRALVDANGTVLPVISRDLRGGNELLRIMDERVPADLRFPDPEL